MYPRSSSLSTAWRFFVFLIAGLTGALAASKPAADNAKVSTALTPDGGRIVVDVQGVPPAPPLFFSATVEQAVRVGVAEISGEARLKLHVVQGRPEVMTLGLSGDGEVIEVSGKGLRDWSVRQVAGAAGRRLLDVRPLLVSGVADAQDLELVVKTRLKKPAVPGAVAMLLLTPGDAVGFASKVVFQSDGSLDLRVTSAAGMVPLEDANGSRDVARFFSTGEGRIEVKLAQRGAALAEAELVGAQLSGKMSESAGSVNFRLRGQLRAQKVGARLRVLSGRAALSEKAAGDGWHVELVQAAGAGFGGAVAGVIGARGAQ